MRFISREFIDLDPPFFAVCQGEFVDEKMTHLKEPFGKPHKTLSRHRIETTSKLIVIIPTWLTVISEEKWPYYDNPHVGCGLCTGKLEL